MSLEYMPRGLQYQFSGDRLKKREGEALCDTCGARFVSGQNGLKNIIDVHTAIEQHLSSNPDHSGRISEDSCGNVVSGGELKRRE